MNALETFAQKTKQGLGLYKRPTLIAALRPGYEALLGALYGSKGLKRSVQGEKPIRLLPRYRSISEAAEPSVFAALKSCAKPGGTVIDIGANVGLFSLVMARWVGPTGRIFAFEPAPESLEALRKHIQLNAMVDRIEAIGCAVSDTVGETTFYAHTFSGENSLNLSFGRRVPAASAVVVPVNTIDAFCAAHHIEPSLIKIDIEGYEIHALHGARNTLIQGRPRVVVEMHPTIWPEIGATRAQAERLLAELRYQINPLEGQGDPLAQYGHVILRPVE
jgi:FkbM family methyltransferase